MSIIRQSDITSEELRQASGNTRIDFNKRSKSRGRGGELDEDGETSSIVTIFELSRERFEQVTASYDLATVIHEM